MISTATLLLTTALLTQAGSPARHSTPPPTPHRSYASSSSRTTHTTVTLPSQLNAGDQIYEGNLKGLRRYLTDVRESDRELFLSLDPELRKLETQSRTAWTVGLVGIGAGVVMIGAGMYGSSVAMGKADVFDDVAWEQSRVDFNNALLLSGGGVLVAAGSIFAIALMQPSKDQFLDLINRHNRIRPDQPLRLQLGFAPAPKGHGAIALAYATF